MNGLFWKHFLNIPGRETLFVLFGMLHDKLSPAADRTVHSSDTNHALSKFSFLVSKSILHFSRSTNVSPAFSLLLLIHSITDFRATPRVLPYLYVLSTASIVLFPFLFSSFLFLQSCFHSSFLIFISFFPTLISIYIHAFYRTDITHVINIIHWIYITLFAFAYIASSIFSLLVFPQQHRFCYHYRRWCRFVSYDYILFLSCKVCSFFSIFLFFHVRLTLFLKSFYSGL